MPSDLSVFLPFLRLIILIIEREKKREERRRERENRGNSHIGRKVGRKKK